MTQAAKAQEPSMEEILASIRRIIADEEPAQAPVKSAASDSPPAARPAPIPAALHPSSAAIAGLSQVASSSAKEDDIDVLFSDDDVAKQQAESDVFELTEDMTAQAEAEIGPSFRKIESQPDVVFADVENAEENQARASFLREMSRAEQARPGSAEPDTFSERPLLSNTTTAAVDSAFNTLAHTVLVQNARTLEDLVKEMLRPMLKTWLDDNLPGLVERLVRAEIERVSRGR